MKKFKLGNKTYSIKYVDKLDELLGQANSATCKIEIAKNYNGDKLPQDSIDQTVYHEVVHCILDEMAEHELSENETFVQTFSLLLHQFINTVK